MGVNPIPDNTPPYVRPRACGDPSLPPRMGVKIDCPHAFSRIRNRPSPVALSRLPHEPIGPEVPWFSMTSSRDDESEEEQLPKNTAIADSKIMGDCGQWSSTYLIKPPGLLCPQNASAPSCESVGNLAYEVDMIVRLI